jgi:hypothetical protein
MSLVAYGMGTAVGPGHMQFTAVCVFYVWVTLVMWLATQSYARRTTQPPRPASPTDIRPTKLSQPAGQTQDAAILALQNEDHRPPTPTKVRTSFCCACPTQSRRWEQRQARARTARGGYQPAIGGAPRRRTRHSCDNRCRGARQPGYASMREAGWLSDAYFLAT